jgi:hypothetical protein
VKKTRHIKKPEPRFDSIETGLWTTAVGPSIQAAFNRGVKRGLDWDASMKANTARVVEPAKSSDNRDQPCGSLGNS